MGVGAYLTAVALFSFGCFTLLPKTRPVVVPVREPFLE